MKTVYVGMSGGVDSSVATALLAEQGYRVVGVYMKNWTQPVGGVDCSWQQDLADARASAAVLDVPFKVFDFQKQYRDRVVEVMVTEYRAGRTPNPDILCNAEIKFKLFLETALADGADLIATGHYARVVDGRLLTAADDNKDQTYFLARIPRAALDKALFPLGNLTKPQVRARAAKLGLPTAAKPDSQGICFIGEVGIKDFLQQYIEPRTGSVVRLSDGAEIGRHDGAAFYTIGQRHGLGIGGGRPYYVAAKDMAVNTVVVTDNPADLVLETSQFALHDPHWLGEEPAAGRVYQIRSRYRAQATPGTVTHTPDGWQVELERPEHAVSAGQTAVVYDGDLVLGGGFIALAKAPLQLSA